MIESADTRRVTLRIAKNLEALGIPVGRVADGGRWRGAPFVMRGVAVLWMVKERTKERELNAYEVGDIPVTAYVDWGASLRRAHADAAWADAVAAVYALGDLVAMAQMLDQLPARRKVPTR